MTARILVAGIGNIFLGDDGFGPEVMRYVCDRVAGSDGVRATDYGIGGMHLAYDLLDGWDAWCLSTPCPTRAHLAQSMSSKPTMKPFRAQRV